MDITKLLKEPKVTEAIDAQVNGMDTNERRTHLAQMAASIKDYANGLNTTEDITKILASVGAAERYVERRFAQTYRYPIEGHAQAFLNTRVFPGENELPLMEFLRYLGKEGLIKGGPDFEQERVVLLRDIFKNYGLNPKNIGEIYFGPRQNGTVFNMRDIVIANLGEADRSDFEKHKRAEMLLSTFGSKNIPFKDFQDAGVVRLFPAADMASYYPNAKLNHQ